MNKDFNSPNSVGVGSIFQMSWGWDQTNVNYFQVTRLSRSGVFVREIGGKGVEGTGGFMSQDVVPVKDNFLDRSQWCGGYNDTNPELFRKLSFSDGKAYFSIKGRYFARLSDGTKTYSSWYA